MSVVKSGLEVLIQTGAKPLVGKRTGIICHQASVDRELNHLTDLLSSIPAVNVTYLFAPEHGLHGTAQDQVPTADEDRPDSDFQVHSLYGQTYADLSPKREVLKELDILVCDLQDVGSRYYTFNWTMALAMKACADAGIEFKVLDRPNPIGGISIEGNVLDPGFASFVGLYPIPVRHGLTTGELALLLNQEFKIECELEVVQMRGWHRDMWFDETDLPGVMPSPNMPALETAIVYAGTCLIEATNVSEGRGTTRPFELIGAPFIDSQALSTTMNRLELPGVRFRAARFEPTFNKWKHQPCGGIQIHVLDRNAFKPYLTGITLLKTIRDLYPEDFRWRKPPYEFEHEKLPIDILCGTDVIRKRIETGNSLAEIESEWQKDLASFRELREHYLLY